MRYKGIPIAAAKAVAEAYDKDQVIIVTWDKAHDRTHVTTYGKTTEECLQAAKGGNLVKRALGWPPELCDAEPKRRKPRCHTYSECKKPADKGCWNNFCTEHCKQNHNTRQPSCLPGEDAMSSPSNIVVVLTHVPDPVALKEAALKTWKQWLETPPERGGPDKGDRLYHTDQAVDALFEWVASGHGYSSGSQGDSFTWSYCGNYICRDDFTESIRPFVELLVHQFEFTCCTVMFQHEDEKAEVYQFAGKGPWTRLRVAFSFDADLDKVSGRS